jgi:hypothetical protein
MNELRLFFGDHVLPASSKRGEELPRHGARLADFTQNGIAYLSNCLIQKRWDVKLANPPVKNSDSVKLSGQSSLAWKDDVTPNYTMQFTPQNEEDPRIEKSF